jgi:hypothetical protein
MSADGRTGRIVPAVHGRQETRPDPEFEIGLSESLDRLCRAGSSSSTRGSPPVTDRWTS